MKAEITADGCLCVTAETPVEAYALRKWHEEGEGGRLFRVVWDYAKKEDIDEVG